MIQVLGLRDYVDNKSGKRKKRECFFEKKWRFESVEEVLSNPTKNNIPENEQYNIYFTVADCIEESGRKLQEQWVIPFDIDNLSEDGIIENAVKAVSYACLALGIDYNKTGVIFSGNGVQFFVKTAYPIQSPDYFELMRPHYKVMCDKIQAALLENNITGNVDPSVWSPARLMRMPETDNRKENRPVRRAKVLQSLLLAQDFDMQALSGILAIQKPEQIRPEVLRQYPAPDTKAVLAECEFLKWCKEKPNDVKEYQWYAMCSVTARLDDGANLTHRLSEGYNGYDFYETEQKVNQAVNNAGPRTCGNIGSLWDGCKNCKHYGTSLTSPILIRGETYTGSASKGFREERLTKDGNITQGKPVYDDLIRAFSVEHPYVSHEKERIVYIFNGKYWKEMSDLKINEWTSKKVKFSPSATEMSEFLQRLKATRVVGEEWFTDTTVGLMNFQNGVLDLKNMDLSLHNPEHGFTSVLPYTYDRTAKCPTWDKFIEDVSDDRALADILEEYAGYSIVGGPCKTTKALLLLGTGANGKNTFVDTIKAVAGKGNYSSVLMGQLNNEQYRIKLRHKLFNVSEEADVNDLSRTAYFKIIADGGEISGKEVFRPPVDFENRAKLIILANEMPENPDTSHGFFRRLIIIKMNKVFSGANDNKDLREILRGELSGICNRLIEGYLRLQKNQWRFKDHAAVQQALDDYQLESNSALAFAEERLSYNEEAESYEFTSDIYSEYSNWCEFRNLKPYSLIKFVRETHKDSQLKNCGFGFQKRDGVKNRKAIKNIKLLKEN